MAEPVVALLGYGTFLLHLSLLAGILYYIGERTGLVNIQAAGRARDFLSRYYRELGFLQAVVATSGSLYMSNILGWEPCRLCWFQRILIYPLVVIFAVALLLEKEDPGDYIIPLALIGIPVSTYHYVIQRIEQFHSAGCSVLSVSCETTYSFYLGYISIPMMALTALVVILLLAWRFGRT